MAQRAIQATERYVEALRGCTELPEPIGPDWHAYVRHPYVEHLLKLDSYVSAPWRSTENGKTD